MEATGDKEGGNSEDLTGRKKPKLQMLTSRLFGKMKRKRNEGVMKQSQSATDIMEGIQNLEDDFSCSQSMLGSRALSHDSIFLADQCQSDPEPPRVLSQENIHGRIRALQMKLQQQNMHLGPPFLVLPIKRNEDAGGSSEDDGLPHSPPEILGLGKNMPYKCLIPPRNHRTFSLGGTGSEEEEQPSAQPVSPLPISHILAPISPSVPVSGVDFSTPPQFVPCLDNSAARHRMSIKPRNQRASTKSRRLPISAGCRPRSESMNNLERPLTESEEEEGAAVAKEMTRVRSYSSQIIRPGEVLTAPPFKIPLSALPLKSLVGAGDGYCNPAMSQPERSISPSRMSFQHSVLKQQMPTRESAASQKSEAATTSIGTKHTLISAVPTSSKRSGDQKESPFSSQLKNSQESAVSTISSKSHICSVESGENQPVSEKVCITLLSHDKKEVKDILHEGLPRGQALVFPQAGGVALRPPSLRRNTSPLDDKVVGRNLKQISTASLLTQGDQLHKESTGQQRPISGSFHFSASSGKSHERQRTGSFTGVVDQAGANREPVPTPLLVTNLKTQDKLSTTQIKRVVKDPLSITEPQRNERAASTSAMTTKLRDSTPILSAGRDRGDRRASEMQETGVEATEEDVQEGVEEADEASEDLKGNEETKGEEERSAFGVKLRTTSLSLKLRTDKAQSDLRPKQHNTEVSTVNPAWLMESSAPAGQNGSSVGPVKENMTATASRKSPIHISEALVSAQVSSSPPQSASRDKDRIAPIRLDELGIPAQPSSSLIKGTVHSVPKESTQVSLNVKEVTQTCSVENIPISSAVKEPQETSSELSWMSMAREKTRSLQQLFTSRLPDFASLQTTTRSTNVSSAPPQTQISPLQPSSGPTKPLYQSSAMQPPARLLQTTSTQPQITQVTVGTTHSAQPPGMQSSIRLVEPSTGQSGVADFSIKQSLSTINEAQTPQLSVRTGQSSAATSATTHSATKPVQIAAVYQSTVHFNAQTAEQQLSQPQAQAQSTTQSNLHLTQTTYLNLSSPKLTPHQMSQGTHSVLSQPRPQTGEDVSSKSLGTDNCTAVHQGKGTMPRAGGLGSKALVTERWENQAPHAAKVGDQKSTPESQPPSQSPATFRTMSSLSKVTESAASSGSMRLEREDKWQKKTVPPSSPPSSSSSLPPPSLQSISDSGQPSWMELAKRKSLAWSDKTMD